MKATCNVSYSKFEASLNYKLQRVRGGAKGVLKSEAESIMEVSKALCPQDTGTLVSTAFVSAKGTNGFTDTVTFGYSGSAINPKSGISSKNYMVKVHEDLDTPHSVGQAKFLEIPVTAYLNSGFYSSFVNKIKGLLSGGSR